MCKIEGLWCNQENNMDNEIYDIYELIKASREEEYENYEEWEAEAYFYYKQDWQGLVEFRYRKAEEHPYQMFYKWSLGDAYVLNKEYEKAIRYLSGLYKESPEDPNIQHSLLDALAASGNDESWNCLVAVNRKIKA